MFVLAPILFTFSGLADGLSLGHGNDKPPFSSRQGDPKMPKDDTWPGAFVERAASSFLLYVDEDGVEDFIEEEKELPDPDIEKYLRYPKFRHQVARRCRGLRRVSSSQVSKPR